MKKNLFVVLALIAINSDIKSASIIMSKEDSLKTVLVQKYNQTFIAPEIKSGNYSYIYTKPVDASAWLKALTDIENYISPSIDISGYYSNAIKFLKTTSQDLINIINKGATDKNSLKEISSISSNLDKNLDEWQKLESNFKSSNYRKLDLGVTEKKTYLALLIKAAQLLSNAGPDSLYAGYPGGLIYILMQAGQSSTKPDISNLKSRIQPKSRFVSLDNINKVIKS